MYDETFSNIKQNTDDILANQQYFYPQILEYLESGDNTINNIYSDMLDYHFRSLHYQINIILFLISIMFYLVFHGMYSQKR